MKKIIRSITAAAAFTVSLAAAPIVVRAAPVPEPQARDHDHVDYPHNSYYRMGNREGYEDHRKKQQRAEHNHKYRSDDDRKAHDYGYQQGWQGQRAYRPQ